MTDLALQVSQVRTIGIGTIIALVVIGILLAMIITSLIGRSLILIVVLVLGALVWEQRAVIENHLTKDKCQLSTTFFGIHVKAPSSVVQACKQRVTH